jgi:purine nucleoside phosphorylase
MSAPRLDDSVFPAADALREEGWRTPEALLLLGTGLGTLPSSLAGERRLDLGELPGAPRIWAENALVAGKLGALEVWLIEDAPGELEFGEGGGPGRPAWERAWPTWLAAAAGAQLCVITAAGVTLGPRLGDGSGLAVGTLAALSDHVNFSGTTPLLGLGETRLGPLFPDQSEVHHRGLRLRAVDRARTLGIPLSEAIAACLVGPSLATPAELAWLARTGCGVAVQGLAGPLIAGAHAGLPALVLVAITDSGEEPLRMAQLVDRAEACAPALEDLVQALVPDLVEVARDLEDEL